MLLWQSMCHHCVPRTVSTGAWQERRGDWWCDRRWDNSRRHRCCRHGQEHNDSGTGAGHDNKRDSRSADVTTGDYHLRKHVEQPLVALDLAGHPRALLPAFALRRRTGSLHGWQEKEKEIEEGDARQPALSLACGTARRRGTAGVVAYGTPADGAIHDDANGCTDDGGDGSDGAHGDAHNGRDCRSDDATHNDGNCRSDDDSHAGDWWVRNASVASNGWRRLRDASAAQAVLK